MNPQSAQFPTDLSLQMPVAGVSGKTLRRVCLRFEQAVKATATELLGAEAPTEWIFTTWHGSQVLACQPAELITDDTRAQLIGGALHKGLESVAASKVPPAFMSERILRPLAQLANIRLVDGTTERPILWGAASAIELGPAVQAEIRRLLRRRIQDWGTIEGKLEEISIHGRPSAVVFEPIWGERITCELTPEQLEEARIRLFGARVELTGNIHYRQDGTPSRIEVSTIRRLPESSELPSIWTLRGILKDSA